jgi:hypothetical protein
MNESGWLTSFGNVRNSQLVLECTARPEARPACHALLARHDGFAVGRMLAAHGGARGR